MKTSEAGVHLIERFESLVLRVYSDQAGLPTIGYGHKLRPGESFPNGITQEQAESLLDADVAWAEAAVNGAALIPLTQNQFDALVSFTFNCGAGALRASSVLSDTNRGDFAKAAQAFLLWDKVEDPHTHQLVASQGLLSRRNTEMELFLTPDDDDNPY